MILNISILSFILSAVWVAEVWGAPYSNVYFQSKSEYTPVEYIRYNAPSVPIETQIAQLSAPPVQSAIPVPSYVSPCGSTCLISGQNIAPIASASNILSYKSPISSVPVVLPRDESTSYQYSYIVYDDHTGDQKAQREQSDGSVVRGEYSFIQPDGYVREVQYIADDANGFNAIVKNFLPGSVGETNKVEHVKESHPTALPCVEVKHEHSTEHAVGHESTEHAVGHESNEHAVGHEINEHAVGHEINGHHHSHEALTEAHHNTKVGHHDEKDEGEANPVEHHLHHEVHHEHSERHEHLKELKHGQAEEPHGSSDVVHHTKIHVILAEEAEHPPESHSEHLERHHSEASGHEYTEGHITENHDHQEEVNHGYQENDSHGHMQEQNEPQKEYGEDSSSDSNESSSNESLERQMFLLRAHDGKFSESDESSSESEEDFEELQEGHVEKHQAEHEDLKDHHTAHHGGAEQHAESHEAVAHPADANHEGIHSEQLKEHGHTELIGHTGAHHTKEQNHDEISGVAYSDIIRCVNTAMNTVPSSHNIQPSALTYIILNKPC